MLESRKPMIIVLRTIVGLPANPGSIKLVGKRGCPLPPCEMPLLGELDREREGLVKIKRLAGSAALATRKAAWAEAYRRTPTVSPLSCLRRSRGDARIFK